MRCVQNPESRNTFAQVVDLADWDCAMQHAHGAPPILSASGQVPSWSCGFVVRPEMNYGLMNNLIAIDCCFQCLLRLYGFESADLSPGIERGNRHSYVPLRELRKRKLPNKSALCGTYMHPMLRFAKWNDFFKRESPRMVTQRRNSQMLLFAKSKHCLNDWLRDPALLARGQHRIHE